MTYLQAILMGLVQGLGEFLPISSSGHLILAPWLFRFADPGQAFDIALHFGTLLAVLGYFGKDWYHMIRGSIRFLCGPKLRLAGDTQIFQELLVLVLSTIPAAIVGITFEHAIEENLRNPAIVAVNLIIMGVVLLIVDRRDRSNPQQKPITWQQALIIGISQSLALFPGISRSGITITAALLLGVNRAQSARFSFLMSTPIIFGACLLKLRYFPAIIQDPTAMISIVVAAISGFLSIKYLIYFVKNFSYAIFSYYRFLVGTIVLIVYFLRL